jgi:hypothetical protein
MYLMGFSKDVIDAYIIVVGFQAVFNHANVSVRLGPLRYVIVTPNFHHWHHSQDQEALDKNYAAHFAFLDHLFGTAVKSDRNGPSATACWATTCPTASEAAEVPFRLEGLSRVQTFDVVVIGAGAAGLFCAGVAGQRGLKVLLLDHSPKVAEKIRISGGGRANFTNRDIDPRQPHKHFVGENPHFCRSALSRYTPADFIALLQTARHCIPRKTQGPAVLRPLGRAT